MHSDFVNRKLSFVPRTLYLLFLVLCTTSCEQRPDGILSKSEMREVLYDYHLTQSMTDWVPDRTSPDNQPYLDAVFRKHGITQAEFDSSLVWYNAHASELKDIYEDLKERFTVEGQKLQLTLGDHEMATLVAEGGDTTNLWTGPVIIVLRNHPLLNFEKFSVKSDTSFHAGDRFKFTGEVIMMNEERFSRNSLMSVSLSVQANGSKSFGESQILGTGSPFSINLEVPADATPRQVTCYFQYQSDDNTRNFCLVRNLSLIRMHSHTAEADTLTADTLPADLQPVPAAQPMGTKPRQPRLTPEQLRIKTQDDEQKIEIRTAPAVRTPNSIGPTRRKKK